MTNIINGIVIGLFAGVLTSNIVVAQQTDEITVQASRIVAKKGLARVPLLEHLTTLRGL